MMSVIARSARFSPRGAVLPGGLGWVQFAGAAVDGLVLSSITVHALVGLHMGAGTVGVVLAAAAAVALLTAPLSGAIVDRIGFTRAGACFAALSAAALVVYATTRSLAGFAVGAVVFVTAQAASASVRQAIAVVGADDADRTRLRASMHTVLNAGFGCGTVLGVVVLATATDAMFSAAYAVGAAVSLIIAVTTLRLRVPAVPTRRPSTAGAWVAFRDRPFAGAVALACLVQLTMPILSLLLPFWVLGSAAPSWTAGAALAVNTALVIVAQRRWAARVSDARSTARSAVTAAAAIVTAGVVLAGLPFVHSAAAAVVAVIVAVVAVTVTEIAGGAAVWQVALQHVPAWAEGRYQAAFSMSASGARVLGPLIALPLLVYAGPGGWITVSLVMAAACLLIAQRSLSPSTADPNQQGAVQ